MGNILAGLGIASPLILAMLESCAQILDNCFGVRWICAQDYCSTAQKIYKVELEPKICKLPPPPPQKKHHQIFCWECRERPMPVIVKLRRMVLVFQL